jgi:hypothetical protein
MPGELLRRYDHWRNAWRLANLHHRAIWRLAAARRPTMVHGDEGIRTAMSDEVHVKDIESKPNGGVLWLILAVREHTQRAKLARNSRQ